ncbi:MAG: helix-turn-helix domain-containing protein [Halobacteria archaeon]|nr:helix-turn-helix domain-containing protein [Halobacteria archaeon]
MVSLSDLGLSEYEAQVYTALLDSRTATAKELSDESGVPMGRIYDVLENLESRRLIRSQTASRPKKYVPVEPDTAIDRIVEEKKRELQEDIQRYEEVADDLKGKLNFSDSVDERFWTATVGSDDSLDLILERLSTAEERIITVAGGIEGKDPDEVVVSILEMYKDRIREDVDISLLMSMNLVNTLGRNVGKRIGDELRTENFEMRLSSQELHGSFHIIDNHELCLMVMNPFQRHELLAMINLKDPDFADTLIDEFDERWEEAEYVPGFGSND